METEGTPFQYETPDGLTLRGVRWGAGGPPMVYAPGNGFTVETYLPALAPLTSQTTIHGLNPRGHGGSGIPHEFDGWDAPAADLKGFVEANFSEPVVLAGHSFGSMLSLELAAEAPELVRGLLLLDPPVNYGRHEPWPEEYSDRLEERIARTRTRRAEWPPLASAEKWMRARGEFGEWDAAPFEAFLASGVVERERGGVRLACPPWLETRIYQTGPGRKVWDWAEKVTAPTVILRGEESLSLDVNALEEMTGLLPVATLIAVKGGHGFAQEHPRETGAALAQAWEILQRPTQDGETAL